MMLKHAGPCQFPYLTRMTLEDIPNLKHMRGLVEFPSLMHLQLFGLHNLEELCTTTSGFEIGNRDGELQAQYCFPVLRSISVRNCPKLNVKPHFPASLEKLNLSESNEQLLFPYSFSHLLPPLVDELSSCSSPHLVVPCLKTLTLSKMTGSKSGWKFLQYLTALERLFIYGIDDLTPLLESMRSLTSLQRLCIGK